MSPDPLSDVLSLLKPRSYIAGGFDLGGRWSIQFEKHGGVSRSKFAARFKSISGASVMEYLTRWRMLLAADRLARGDEAVSAIAYSLGYASDAAFSTAFKRVMGSAPRAHARRRART